MAIVVPLFIKAGRYEQEKKRSANETSEWSNLRAVIVSQGIRRIDTMQMGVCLSVCPGRSDRKIEWNNERKSC